MKQRKLDSTSDSTDFNLDFEEDMMASSASEDTEVEGDCDHSSSDKKGGVIQLVF